ncbi:MAG: M24 family metallopeptidase, partial [Pseudomonadota bacterium]
MMETLQPTLKRGRDVWDRINMPEMEFHRRMEKIREEMQKESIDCILLYGKGANEYGNPCYLSNFATKMPRGALVAVPLKGDITLIVDGFSRDQPAVKSVTWIDNIRSCRDVAQECLDLLKEQNLIPSTLGFAGLKELMPCPQFQSVSKALGQCKIIDAQPMINRMRMVKSFREQDQIRRSSRIIQRAFDRVCGSPLPEMNERVLEATLDYIARMEGAEDIRILVARPMERGWTMRPAEHRGISEGEDIITYVAVAFERYWSEGIRTFAAGPSHFKEKTSEGAAALYENILQMIEPGVAVAQIYNDALGEIQKSPMEYLPHYGLGQGIGLSPRELPGIAMESQDHFIENMCFTLRLALKDKENVSLMTGDTILLSKSHRECLTR